MLTRILLLLTISWLMGLEATLFSITDLGIPESLVSEDSWFKPKVNQVSLKDIILAAGGLFLIGKATVEIHNRIQGTEEEQKGGKPADMMSVMLQIAVLDIIFSLDSVITAVGMADEIWVMILAVVLAVAVMMFFSEKVSYFITKHPTLKMLALSFLLLIGVMLVAEGIGTHIEKGYIYFAMAFAIMVEVLNMKTRD